VRRSEFCALALPFLPEKGGREGPFREARTSPAYLLCDGDSALCGASRMQPTI
jgi:hypothetical protein